MLCQELGKSQHEWEQTINRWQHLEDTDVGISNKDFKAANMNALVSNYEHAWNKWKIESLRKKIVKQNQMEILVLNHTISKL